jgi:2Fe-2S ferredoxin
MFKVNITPGGETIYVNDEKSLLEQLKANNFYVKSSCGGHANCTDCVIKICGGEDHINQPTTEELKLLGNVFHITKERLACQTIVSGEVSIDLSAHDQKAHEEKMVAKTRNKNVQTKVRKPQEVEKILTERREKAAEKRAAKDDTWHKHWEKQGIKAEKKLGGGKRPKGIKDVDVTKKTTDK